MSTTPERGELVAALYDEQRQAATRAVLFHAAVASRSGINITDVSCIGVLDKDGPMTAGQLARRVGVTRGGAITAILDRLERGGFLRRRRDPHDRRRVIVELVRGEAYRRFQRLLDDFSHDYRALIESYGDAQLALLLDFVARANQILDARTADLLDAEHTRAPG